ncbi:MAG: hypothetical protein HY259_04530 [Chloroflexi bacterium]|nr:hypothetical protein [Chloroflexota bacterium]MBI3732708.1 hypothetical protein [Chloroflexota bacterium]
MKTVQVSVILSRRLIGVLALAAMFMMSAGLAIAGVSWDDDPPILYGGNVVAYAAGHAECTGCAADYTPAFSWVTSATQIGNGKLKITATLTTAEADGAECTVTASLTDANGGILDSKTGECGEKITLKANIKP